jgi:hypothetical protein
MKNTSFIVLLSTIMALAAVLFLLVPAMASGPRTWNLDTRDGDDGAVPDPLLQMEMHNPPSIYDNGQWGEVKLAASGGSQIWIADQAATARVTYRGGNTTNWYLELVTDIWETDGTDYEAEIGEWNGTVFRKFTSAIQNNPPDQNASFTMTITYIFQDFNESINQDCYLAIRVTNHDDLEHTIKCGEIEDSSCLTSPGNDPGYPTPEYTPMVPVSSGVGTAIMITSFAVLSIIMVRARHNRYARTGQQD